jgi:hypothetical protein
VTLRFAPLAAVALALAILTAGCAELDLLLEPTAGGPTRPPLSESPDPAVRAAAASSDATDGINKAEQELEQALQTKDVTHLDKAIQLRPYDSSYRFYRAVLVYAESGPDGRGVTSDLARAAGIEVERHKLLPSGEVTNANQQAGITLLIGLTDALAIAKTHYSRDSVQWSRLNKAYCNMLQDLRKQAGVNLVSEFYSDADCQK